MRQTMAEIAEKVGVSISTVSLVLNDKPGISPDLREVVLKAAREVGYRLPRQNSAKSPFEAKSISVVHYAYPDTNNVSPALSGLFVDFVASIRNYFQDKNVNWTLITSYRDGDLNNLGYHLLDADRLSPDGLLIMGIHDHESSLLQRVMTEDKPVVVLSRDWPDVPISTVSQDHSRHPVIALDHLISMGHRKIAFVARNIDREFDWFGIRLKIYQEKMESLGEWDEGLVVVKENAAQSTRALLEKHPETTAIFAIHDENAVQVLITLNELGYRVPEDISVIGLDNSATPPKGYPSLTTVGFSHEEVGRLAAAFLLKQIDNPELSYGKLFVQSRLIERGSTDLPRNA
jgi:DNA-binding LacI/PurR family transcriptional regulator